MTPLKMKFLLFFSVLLVLFIGTIGNAFYRHNQFYPAVVYLSKSSATLTVVYFFASNLLWLLGYWTMMLFFGELRPSESEELWERLKYIATETLMAFAIFREDFSPHFVLLFAVLLYMKIIHWLGEERVDYLERTPVIPKLFHARIVSLLILLGVSDVSLIIMASKAIQATGPSPHIAFGFEYAILLPSVFCIVLKYVLHFTEIRREAPIEDKAVIMLYGQIVFDFIRLLLYVSYLAVMFKLYLLPLFAFRQIFNTTRNFTAAVNDVVSFKKAVRYMNKFCPTATKDELEATDSVCIVCREDMETGAKKLPCNHIFHSGCLRSWFQKQQTCPTCRFKILNIVEKVTFEQNNEQGQRNTQTQSNKRQTNGEANQQNVNSDDQETSSIAQPEFHQTSRKCSGLQIPNDQRFPNNRVNNFGSAKTFLSAPAPNELISSQSTVLHDSEILSTLSSQDLLAVERDTRVGIENRIKCLQNMSVMLDSTIAMMHQYCHATALSGSKDCDGTQQNIEIKEDKMGSSGCSSTLCATEKNDIEKLPQ